MPVAIHTSKFGLPGNPGNRYSSSQFGVHQGNIGLMIIQRNERWYAAVVFAGCALFAILNARWIWLFRRNQPFDIDEASYLGISLIDYHGFIQNGVRGWFATVEAPSSAAPITTALSSLLYLVFGPDVLVAFIVTVLSGVATIVATYYIGKCIGDERVGVISSILVATSPIVINYARSYNFALPATAITTIALLGLVRSNRFASIRWAVVFGICVGLMPLTRTMAIAFVPGLILAGLVQVVVAADLRLLRARVFVLSLAIAIGVAAIWLVPNGQYVFDYLWSFGYGVRNIDSGPPQSLLELDTWLYNVQTLLEYLYVPLLVLLIIGACLVLISAVRLFVAEGFRRGVVVVARSGLLPLVILVAEGIAALTSSRNKGSAFIAPLVPAMVLIAVWGFVHLGRSNLWRAWVMAALVTFAVVLSLPFVDLTLTVAQPWRKDIPFFGIRTITDGKSPIQIYEAAAGYSTSDPVVPVDRTTGEAWIELSKQTAQKLSRLDEGVQTAFAFRGYLYNVGTVGLAQLQAGPRTTPTVEIAPEVMANSVEAYVQWLVSGDAAHSSFLLTSSGVIGEFLPHVNPENMEIAADGAGFARIDSWSIPDGRVITMWRRQESALKANPRTP